MAPGRRPHRSLQLPALRAPARPAVDRCRACAHAQARPRPQPHASSPWPVRYYENHRNVKSIPGSDGTLARHIPRDTSLMAARSTIRNLAATAWGVVIGTLGGLIGLGGAEFRLPLLIGLF